MALLLGGSDLFGVLFTCDKIYPYQLYSWISFAKYIQWWKPHHNKKHFTLCCPALQYCTLQTPAPGNHWSAFCPVALPLHECYVNGITQCVVFRTWLPSLCVMFPRCIHDIALISGFSFVLLSSIPLRGYTIVCLSIFLLGIWSISGVWQLGIKLLQTFLYRSLCGNRALFMK